MIQFRLGDDYILRFDALVARLGLKRPLLVRNLLSLDSDLIDVIENKAKTLNQLTIDESVMRVTKKSEELPEIITIRLDKEQERRFNALAASLGVGSKVQVLRNLLSGDPVLIAALCKKAKSIKLDPLGEEEIVSNITSTSTSGDHKKTGAIDPTDATEELIRKKIAEYEKELRAELGGQGATTITKGGASVEEETPSTEHRNTSQQPTKTQIEGSLFPSLQSENEHLSSKSKRGRKKNRPTNVDHSEERQQIIDYFTSKSGKVLGYDSKDSINAIDKMLDAGKPVSEFMLIIDNMCYWWKEKSPDMYRTLTPATIFRQSKWENNLSSTPKLPKGHNGPKRSGNPHSTPGKYDEFYL